MELSEDDRPFMPEDDTRLDSADHSVTHCVLLEMKEEPDMKKLQSLLLRVRARVPGLIELHFGKNDMKVYKGKNESSSGNTHALVSRHINGNALLVYQKHPDHVALSRFLFALLRREPTVVDFVNVPSKL